VGIVKGEQADNRVLVDCVLGTIDIRPGVCTRICRNKERDYYWFYLFISFYRLSLWLQNFQQFIEKLKFTKIF